MKLKGGRLLAVCLLSYLGWCFCTGSGRNLYPLARGRPHTAAGTFDQVIISQYIQIALNCSRSDPKFFYKLLCRNRTVMADKHINGFDTG